jgi:hypothetical protein
MKIKSQKDFWSGLMFMATGVAFAWGATNYTIGEGARMGPGYFPLVLGILLSLIGLFIVFEAMVVETEDGEPIGKWAWKPLFFIIGSNVIFGICIGGLPKLGIPAMGLIVIFGICIGGLPKLGIPALGLIVGIYALTFVAARAGEEFRAKEVAVLATVLAVLSYVAFIVLLKLQFPVWPSFLTA